MTDRSQQPSNKPEPESRQNRRGATLVLVAVLMSVLIGLAALVVDFSRVYSFKAELKRLTDAAAMSGAIDVMNGEGFTEVSANVATLKANNTIETTAQAEILDEDITPVYWDFSTGTATNKNWGDVGINGVRVVGRYTTTWTLAKYFGGSTKLSRDTSIAAYGYINSSVCVKPWAIPYSAVLLELGREATDLGHDLTEADLQALVANQHIIGFKDPQGNEGADINNPGNFGWVDPLPEQTGNQNIEIADAIKGCASDPIAVGDSIPTTTGNRNNPEIKSAIDELCGAPTNCDQSYPPILVPIFEEVYRQGGVAEYVIKYIGAFKLTYQGTQACAQAGASLNAPPPSLMEAPRMDASRSYWAPASFVPSATRQGNSGNGGENNGGENNGGGGQWNVCGYLTSVSVPPSGGLTNIISPIKALAIVK